MTRPTWAPFEGLTPFEMVPGSPEALRLAKALEAVRRSVCCYNAPSLGRDVYCDCKYGLEVGQDPRGSGERTGCPEMREVVNWLLGS